MNTSNKDENVCGICQESLSEGNAKTIHKSANWQHDFHKFCIDQWIKVCEKSNKPPCCPMCVTFIIPNNIIKTIKSIDEPHAHCELAATHRWQNIANSANPLFMGIMLCSQRVPIMKLLQSDCGIDGTWTLERIKEYIKTKNREVYFQKGMTDRDNMAHNIQPSNWLRWKYPTLRITDAYYGTPSQGGRIFAVNHQLDNNQTAKEMYIEYQSMIGFCVKYGKNYSLETMAKLDEVYNKTLIENYDYSMPDVIMWDELFFNNKENPIIPVEHRKYRKHERSTEHSLAWLVLDIDYE